MNAFDHPQFAPRHLRAIAALLLIVAGTTTAQADSVFKCRDARGQIAYQDSACADPARQTRIEIAPAPSLVVAPEHVIGADARPSRRPAGMRAATARHGGKAGAVSYECRTADGEVFYKHSGCPKTITVTTTKERRGAGRKAAARGSATRSMAVSARPLPRSEVCKRMTSGGAVGRAGREHDDAVSTYDRNAGRDPCW